MSDSTSTEIKPLRGITRHAASDCISWFTDDSSDEQGDFSERYTNWLRESFKDDGGDLLDTICFLDITIKKIHSNAFFGIVMSPDEGKTTKYLNLLEELNNPQGDTRTVGSHQVFQAGLPKFDKGVQPQTGSTLQNALKIGTEIPDDQFLETTFPHTEAVGPPVEASELDTKLIQETNVGYPENPIERDKAMQKASEKSCTENWHHFVAKLKGSREKLCNARNEPLSVVRGVPLCLWSGKNGGRSYTPVAQIFIGLGGNPKSATKQADRILRRIVQHAWRVHATDLAKREGQQKGRQEVIHRLPEVLADITDTLLAEDSLQVLHPRVYVLQMITSIQKGQLPRWEKYESLCEREGRYALTDETLCPLWEEIAKPVGLKRAEADKKIYDAFREVYTQFDFQYVPRLEVTGETKLSDRVEAATLISLCCPLLIEAYQHTLMYSMIEYSQGVRERPSVVMRLQDGEIQIKNPRYRLNSPNTPLRRGTQKDEIRKIEEITNQLWTVEYPASSEKNFEEDWIVTLSKTQEG